MTQIDQDWIPVGDSLPDDDQVVFLVLKCDGWPEPRQLALGGIADCGSDGWYWCHTERWGGVHELEYDDPIEVDVTHWMPLPTLPVEDTK